MTSVLIAIVLAAGAMTQPGTSKLDAPPAPPTAPASQPTGQPATGVPMSKLDILMQFKDASLVPAWAVKAADRNAALVYMKAIVELPAPVRDAARDLDWAGVTMAEASQQPEAFRKAMGVFKENSAQWFELTREASALDHCDFELSYENGVGMLLPHLGQMRNLARCMRVRARVQAIQGDYDGAAETLAACMRCGAHVSVDRILISSLVSTAITGVAVEEGEALVATGKLSAAGAAKLRAAIAKVQKTDGFGVQRALEMERDLFLGWLVLAMKQGPNAPEAVAAILGGEPNSKTAEGLRSLDETKLKASVEQAKKAYGDVLAAWPKADAAAELAKINDRVQAGEYGLVATVSMPSFMRARQSVEKGVTNLNALDDKLAKIAK